MKLHEDKDSFRVLLNDIGSKVKIRTDILEKDYYITLMLEELSRHQDERKAYFKGGTALYKALHCINRFSEDIDLTVFVDDCKSETAKQKKLHKSVDSYTCLTISSCIKSMKGSAIAEYSYESIFGFTVDDLQRFGKVKVEATSFTVSEPRQKVQISPIIFEKANDDQKNILIDRFAVMPFNIESIKLERIFVDKIFAAEYYFQRARYLDAAKHIYDLIILFENDRIQEFLADPSLLSEMLGYIRLEEKVRLGGISSELLIRNFRYLKDALINNDLEVEYNRMQRIYIFSDHDQRPLSMAEGVFAAISRIKE